MLEELKVNKNAYSLFLSSVTGKKEKSHIVIPFEDGVLIESVKHWLHQYPKAR